MAQKQKQEKYVYATGYKGMTARVPESKLAEWKEEQEALNSGKKSRDSEGVEEFLAFVRNL